MPSWLQFRDARASRRTRTLNLSANGALFGALHEVENGHKLLVALDLEDGKPPLECKGEVRWARQVEGNLHVFGVRFLDLDDEERKRIGRRLSPDPRPQPALV